MSTTKQLLVPLTFNRKGLQKIGNDSSSTGMAIVLIFFNSLLQGIAGYLGQSQTTQISENYLETSTGIAGFLFGFGFYFLFLLFYSWGVNIAIGWFGGKADTMEVLRMIGFSSIWLIIGTIISFVGLLNLAGIFSLIFLIVFSIGLGASSNTGPIRAFIAAILAVFICGFVIFLLFLVLFLAFGSLFIL